MTKGKRKPEEIVKSVGWNELTFEQQREVEQNYPVYSKDPVWCKEHRYYLDERGHVTGFTA